jgi:hypothetical protein
MPEDRMRPKIQGPINRIVEIINECLTAGGMSKDDTEDLRRALEDMAAGIASARRS